MGGSIKPKTKNRNTKHHEWGQRSDHNPTCRYSKDVALVKFLRPIDISGANLWGTLKALLMPYEVNGVKMPWKLKALKTVGWEESKGKEGRIYSFGIKGKPGISAT